jgi:hypothetical protein
MPTMTPEELTAELASQKETIQHLLVQVDALGAALDEEQRDREQREAEAAAEILLGSVPVGSIVPFSGTLTAAEELTARGWWVCDGRQVDDPLSAAFHTLNTPNLAERFLLGSREAGRTGGQASHQIADQTVTVIANDFVDPATSFGALLGPHVGQAFGNFHRIRSSGTVAGTSVPTTPPFFSVIYLLKVR